MSVGDNRPEQPRRRIPGKLWALIISAVGAVLVAASLVALHHDRAAPTSFGPASPAGNSSSPSPTRAPSTGQTPPAPRVSRVPSPPAQLAIPTLGVRAAVRNVVTVNGVLGVPDNIADVGWWTGSVPPGSAKGSTVIDGHVDSAVTGTGALFRLTDLRAGDTITVTNVSGVTLTYRVYARQIFVKHQGLPAQLFTTQGPHRLVVITCGGPFDAATRNYEDNIVVLASPLPTS